MFCFLLTCRYIINHPDEDMEFEEESTVSNATLTSTGGSHNRPKQAVKLVELGPRMCMRLMLVESGLYSGEFLYNKQTKSEEKDVLRQRHVEKELQSAEVKQALKEEKEKEEEEKEYRKEMSEFNKERDRRMKQKKEDREKKEKAQKEKEKEKKVKGKVFHKKGKK
jgi:DNA polymerase III alpha subunit (gram-positive type)